MLSAASVQEEYLGIKVDRISVVAKSAPSIES